MEITVAVKGMRCGGCEKAVERALMTCDGVLEVKASHQDAQVAIQFDPNRVGEAQLRQTIANAGYQAL